jgi:hypothetical protein
MIRLLLKQFVFIFILFETIGLQAQWYLNPEKVKTRNVTRICLQSKTSSGQIDSMVFYENGAIKDYIMMYSNTQVSFNSWSEEAYNFNLDGSINQIVYNDAMVKDNQVCRSTSSLEQFFYSNGLLKSRIIYDFHTQTDYINIIEYKYTDSIYIIRYKPYLRESFSPCRYIIPMNIIPFDTSILGKIYKDSLNNGLIRIIHQPVYESKLPSNLTLSIYYISHYDSTIQSISYYTLSEYPDSLNWDYLGEKYKLKDSLVFHNNYKARKKIYIVSVKSVINPDREKYKTTYSKQQFLEDAYWKANFLMDLALLLKKHKKVTYIEYKTPN